MNEIVKKLKERLDKFDTIYKDDFRHELREITQELVLMGLSLAGFFDKASFHGGTSLRILHGIERYSEDLDFMADKFDKDFKWKPYLDKVKDFVEQYGCFLEIIDKSKDNTYVKKAFIKDSSIEQMMNMSWTQKSGTPEKIQIKVEIDVNPPDHAKSEIKSHNFPSKFDVKIHDLPSLFAGKCHALLCREYEKGRDWFDLIWFVNKGAEPNYKYLDVMLDQLGPWKNLKIESDKTWLSNELLLKNDKLDFVKINNDIKRFSNTNNNIFLDKENVQEIINKFKNQIMVKT
jgi:predicted nucleotidyltransferase component of viral defense system